MWDDIQIRTAMTSDLAAVTSCADHAFGVYPQRSGIWVELALEIRAGSVHVICDAARVLGYISFSPSRGHLFVETIAVRPDRHGEGLGSRLLSFAEREALRLGLSCVKLFTDGKIADNLTFYRRRGYRETDRYDEGGFSRVFYSKDIAPPWRWRRTPAHRTTPLG